MISVATDDLPVGRRLIPTLATLNSRLSPDSIFTAFPLSPDLKSWHHVTYRELEVAVDSLAWWLTSIIGTSSKYEALAYMGCNDLRYMVFWLAAIKCGYCTLNPSPRNSVEEHTSVLYDTNCTKFFFTHEMKSNVEDIQRALGDKLQTFQLSTYPDICSKPHRPYAFFRQYEELCDQPALIFHTSGSTGMPKPIYLKHSYFAAMDNLNLIPNPEGRKPGNWTVLEPESYNFDAFPLFHIAGATLAFAVPIFQRTISILQPSDLPLTDTSFIQISAQFELQSIWSPPSYLEELSTSPEAMKQLSAIDYIISGGGPLSKVAGDALNEISTLFQLMGNTEMAVIPTLINKDWSSFEWNPFYGIEMEPTDDSKVFEAVLHRDPKKSDFHAIFHTFPGLTTWRTRDLFIRTSANPDTWKFVGRTDDVIVLSNGEKFNPVNMQTYIQSDPLIKGALVIGQGRFQVALLVEPDRRAWDGDVMEDFIEMIWPTIQNANARSTATGQVFRNKILVTSRTKPMSLTPKGTIIRGRTIARFVEEIEDLYTGHDAVIAPSLPGIINETTMEEFVKECLKIYRSSDDLPGVDDDLFVSGVNSLQTMGLANSLSVATKSLLDDTKSSQPTITSKIIYQNPSIRKLAGYLTVLLNGQNPKSDGTRVDKIASMVEKHASLPTNAIRQQLAPTVDTGLHVILTGTTASLGTYLLFKLLSDDKISKVYCFNRTADGLQRTTESLKQKGLAADLTKAEFLHTSLGKEGFGLSAEKHKELLHETHVVCHNAWAVNFNYQLETFEDPHIKAVAHLIEFSVRSRHTPHLFFISTVGTVADTWESSDPLQTEQSVSVPELAEGHDFAPIRQGYAESKHVSEKILARGAKVGVPVTIARVGQIAGPTSTAGKWNETDWLPRILQTSKLLKQIPNSLSNIQSDDLDWVPVDKMADACVELLQVRLASQQAERIRVYHLVNPRTVPWSEILGAILTHFREKNITIEPVPLHHWLDLAYKYAETHENSPVSSLLEIFQQLPKRYPLEQTETLAHSQTIASMEAISPELMRNWLIQWDL